MGEHRWQLQGDMQVVVLQPGDKLVIGVKRQISPAEAARLRAQVRQRLPGVDLVIIAAEQLLAYRPDEPTGQPESEAIGGQDN